MSSVYKRFIEIESEIKKLNEEKESMLVKIWELNQNEFESKETGTIDVKRDGFAIRFVKKVTTKVTDPDGLMKSFPSLCNVKNSVSLIAKEYNSLPKEEKNIADSFLETKPAKPTISVSVVE